MSSDEADSKTEEMDLETKNDDSKGDERDSSPEPAKTNSKVNKKKAPPAPKIKAPAKKRVKAEQTEKETVEEEVKKEKKKVEESEDDEEEEGEDDITDDKKNGIKKGVPLLDQPLEISGSRNRKQVERFSVVKKENSSEETKIIIPEGNGKPLGEIPIIDNNLQRYSVENLKLLHKICFNRTGRIPVIKKNIRLFNGFDFDKDSSDYEKKVAMISKFVMKDLKTLCTILDLEKLKKKEEMVEFILKFLLKPEDSGKRLPEGRSKRKNANLKTYDESSDSESNPDPKKKKSPRTKGKKKNLKEDPESGSEKGEEQDDKKPEEEEEKNEDDITSLKSENESDVDEEPKKKKVKKAPVKKEKKTAAPPKKRAAAKRAALAKKKTDESDDGEAEEEDNAESGAESEESDDEPLAKTNKAHPTDDEIKAYVKSILEGADLEEITMKTVCKQVYSHYPEFDLGQKKSFIKTTVKSLISS